MVPGKVAGLATAYHWLAAERPEGARKRTKNSAPKPQHSTSPEVRTSSET